MVLRGTRSLCLMLKFLDCNAFRDALFRLRDPGATEIIAQEAWMRCTQVGTLGRVRRSGSAPTTNSDLRRPPDIPPSLFTTIGLVAIYTNCGS